MQTVTLGIKDKQTEEKVLWLLDHFKSDGVEIMEREDISDLRAILATRGEETISLDEYLANED